MLYPTIERLMEKDTSVLETYLEKIYVEKSPDKIKSLFLELIPHIKVVEDKDKMNMNVLQHFCVVSGNFLEANPDCVNDVFEAILKAAKTSNPTDKSLHDFLNMSPSKSTEFHVLNAELTNVEDKIHKVF